MTALHFSRAERRSLAALADSQGRCPQGQLPPEHAAKFRLHRLITPMKGDYYLTVRGQIEALRQHFRLPPATVETGAIKNAMRHAPQALRARIMGFNRRAA